MHLQRALLSALVIASCTPEPPPEAPPAPYEVPPTPPAPPAPTVMAEPAPAPSAPPAEEPKKVIITPSDPTPVIRWVYFASESHALQKDAEPLLLEIVQVMRAHPELLRVEVEGHADLHEGRRLGRERRYDAGKQRARDVSMRRAEAVRDFLVKNGVEPARLVLKVWGIERPIADNKTAEGRAKNRRVEFHVLEKAP